VSSFDYTISFGIVWGYGELPDIVAFEEEVCSFLGLCSSIHYHTFPCSEPTKYLFIHDVCYLL
jgi:hypothetical protein